MGGVYTGCWGRFAGEQALTAGGLGGLAVWVHGCMLAHVSARL